MSLRRLQYREDRMVHYQGTRVHPRLGIDHQPVTPVEFLALLVPHVLAPQDERSRAMGFTLDPFETTWYGGPGISTP